MKATVDWSKVGADLRDMGSGWEGAGRKPDAEHGAEPIADRPGCWTSPVRVPEWLRGQPEMAEEPAPAAVDEGSDEAVLTSTYMYGGC